MDSNTVIRFRCECGKKLKADVSLIGRKVKCTECDKINTVPSESTALPTRKRTSLTADDLKVSDKKNSGERSEKSTKAKTEAAKFKGNPGPSRSKPKAKKSKKKTSELSVNPKTPLLGDDSEVDNEASLLPRPSNATDRFKQAPELDPDPADEMIGASDSFDFDPDQIDYSNAPSVKEQLGSDLRLDLQLDLDKKPTSQTNNQESTENDNQVEINTDFEPRFKLKKSSKFSPVLVFGSIAMASLIGIAGVIYLAMVLSSGGKQYPDSFESLNEVQQYRLATINYEKARSPISNNGGGVLQVSRNDRRGN